MKRIFPEPQDQFLPVPLLRRLGALFYDTLISIALVMTTTAIYMFIQMSRMGYDEYQSVTEAGQTSNDPFLSALLLLALFLFFGYFWTKNGQTLGMQAWHLRVQNSDNSAIDWKQALIRFMTAFISCGCFGLGLLWPAIDKRNRSWQCITSKSEIIRLPKTQ